MVKTVIDRAEARAFQRWSGEWPGSWPAPLNLRVGIYNIWLGDGWSR